MKIKHHCTIELDNNDCSYTGDIRTWDVSEKIKFFISSYGYKVDYVSVKTDPSIRIEINLTDVCITYYIAECIRRSFSLWVIEANQDEVKKKNSELQNAKNLVKHLILPSVYKGQNYELGEIYSLIKQRILQAKEYIKNKDGASALCCIADVTINSILYNYFIEKDYKSAYHYFKQLDSSQTYFLPKYFMEKLNSFKDLYDS